MGLGNFDEDFYGHLPDPAVVSSLQKRIAEIELERNEYRQKYLDAARDRDSIMRELDALKRALGVPLEELLP